MATSDINECAAFGHNCTQECFNLKAVLNASSLFDGYVCQCWDGFAKSGFGNGQHVICSTTKGSFLIQSVKS